MIRLSHSSFFSRLVGVCFLLVSLFLLSLFFSFIVRAQDIETPAPSPAQPTTEPAPPAPAPAPTPPVPEAPAPAPTPPPTTEPVAPAPAQPAPAPAPTPPVPAKKPTKPSTSQSLASTDSSLTLLETGDGIVPVLQGASTSESDTIISLFSNSDFLIEIELIFSELDAEIKAEIQNDQSLADNTDEDPNVDLVDPSIIPEFPEYYPEPGSEIEAPIQDDPTLVASQGETQSVLGLMETLFQREAEMTARRFEKDVVVDSGATHKCRADVFRADMQTADSSRARVTLSQNRKKNLPSSLEIGALPVGIDVVFKSNNDYSISPGMRDTVIDFIITRQPGADIGNFTVPIIYTLRDKINSTVVCQLNVLNI